MIFDLPVFTFARKISIEERQAIAATLRKGDILLTSDKLFPAWQWAVGFLGSPRFSHAAIYEGKSNVIEATTFHPSGDGVARTGVDEFLAGRKNVCVLRPKLPSKQHKDNMFAWLLKQIGKPYDFNFNNHDDHTMYCAKLVGRAITTAGLNIPTKCIAGHDLYFPDDFMQSEKMRIVYHKPETAIHKLMNNLPLLLVPVLWITGIAPLWVLVLILLAAGWIQLKT